ncbi:hypothetical protein PEC301899_29930 [Pectobacterium carotovorum subsp. carotovorum]|nr:hypothetical protein PEC301899_29930 [Pectobacterium carotovorum subsp. carotovorum]
MRQLFRPVDSVESPHVSRAFFMVSSPPAKLGFRLDLNADGHGNGHAYGRGSDRVHALFLNRQRQQY